MATGLRFSEIACITPGSFGRDATSVTVAAGYTKNGQTATLAIPDELAANLRRFMAGRTPGVPVFAMSDRGADMVRADLAAAGMPYRDASGRVFDFHALRCQTATLADLAGVSPWTVQRLMRHSTLELTGRYTRPTDADVGAAAAAIPSIRPSRLAPHLPHAGDARGRALSAPVASPDPEHPTNLGRKSLRPKDYWRPVSSPDVFCRE